MAPPPYCYVVFQSAALAQDHESCTKAAATRAVLEAGETGLDVAVVHPSGIIGPYDRKGNHLVQMITDYLRSALPACVRGGYDFADGRDVAEGCLLALEKGRSGNCYILSGAQERARVHIS